MDYKEKDEKLYIEVERMIKGDYSSFNSMYELSAKYIYKLIFDIVKDHHATEDLMQDTYLTIYNKINTLQNPRGFNSWAGRIATNNALMYIRKNKNEVLMSGDEDDESGEFIFDKAADDKEQFIPEEICMNREKQRLIAKILDDLPVEQKICVQYFYYEEMSVQEIADIMQCSTGTVKSRLNYARKAIKAAVIELDEKHGTRLYSLGFMPLFLLIFREEVEEFVLSASGMASGLKGVTVQGNYAAQSTMETTKATLVNETEATAHASQTTTIKASSTAPMNTVNSSSTGSAIKTGGVAVAKSSSSAAGVVKTAVGISAVAKIVMGIMALALLSFVAVYIFSDSNSKWVKPYKKLMANSEVPFEDYEPDWDDDYDPMGDWLNPDQPDDFDTPIVVEPTDVPSTPTPTEEIPYEPEITEPEVRNPYEIDNNAWFVISHKEEDDFWSHEVTMHVRREGDDFDNWVDIVKYRAYNDGEYGWYYLENINSKRLDERKIEANEIESGRNIFDQYFQYFDLSFDEEGCSYEELPPITFYMNGIHYKFTPTYECKTIDIFEELRIIGVAEIIE